VKIFAYSLGVVLTAFAFLLYLAGHLHSPQDLAGIGLWFGTMALGGGMLYWGDALAAKSRNKKINPYSVACFLTSLAMLVLMDLGKYIGQVAGYSGFFMSVVSFSLGMTALQTGKKARETLISGTMATTGLLLSGLVFFDMLMFLLFTAISAFKHML